MFSAIRKPMHLTPATVIVTAALVFAMTGGAYAASKYVITSTKQISPKVLKALKGANGKNGTLGPAGLAGAQGPAGVKGETGAAGAPGANGSNGTPGESVTAKEVKVGEAACSKLGGGEFKVGATTTHACNGSPWTAGGTLPKGSSEHGTWTISGHQKQGENVLAAISFPVPLASALEGPQVHFIAPGASVPPGCNGSFEAPEAESGNLCVFETLDGTALSVGGVSETASLSNPEKLGATGAGVSGSYLLGAANFKSPTTEGEVIAVGDWVVTG
jgi:hypothetical protein